MVLFWSVLLLEELPTKDEESPLPKMAEFRSFLLLEEMPAMA